MVEKYSATSTIIQWVDGRINQLEYSLKSIQDTFVLLVVLL